MLRIFHLVFEQVKGWLENSFGLFFAFPWSFFWKDFDISLEKDLDLYLSMILDLGLQLVAILYWFQFNQS